MPLYFVYADAKNKSKAELVRFTELSKASYFQTFVNRGAFCVFIERELTKNAKGELKDDFTLRERALAYAHLQRECQKQISERAENKERELEYLNEYSKSILPLIKTLCGAI